ncbi:MAG: hypothetical protein EPO22_11170 [Dehalococcoidia bacterium]|nr:MAG: hypothetical protein EPO22_11170 [Dehalococcoidia bacterium]
MPIEKAFAIHATPERIYAALDEELREAEAASDGEFEILKRDAGRSFELRVNIGGVPCWLTYRIEPKGEYTEVSGQIIPFGFRYALFRIITLGMRDYGFAMALVQGLSNLKEALESPDDGADT